MKKWGIQVVTLLLIVLILGAACAPKPAAIPTPTGWEQVVEAAKKEGKVTIYTVAIGAPARAPLAEAFKGKYGITAEFVWGPPVQLAEKVRMEQTAKAYVGDVYEAGGASPFLVWKPAGLLAAGPLELPSAMEKGVWRRDPYSMDPVDKQVVMYHQGIGGLPVINTNLIKPGDEPKSWGDLLDPKWKGKMVMDDPTIPGLVSEAVAILIEMGGKDWALKLAALEPKITRDRREQVDMVAKGASALCFFAYTDYALPLIDAGAPIKLITLKEGRYPVTGFSVAMINNAPNPNAAKVFMNWLLSKEGQVVYSKAMRLVSDRQDVSAEHVAPAMRQATEQGAVPLTIEFLHKWNDAMGVAKDVFKMR